jgi:SAM-dependent methyltransferase
MTPANPSSAAFFEAKYQRKHDPWNFAGSPYEQRRYDATMAALAGRRYTRAFEPGCSVGVLTARLSTICDAVEAIDFSETAVAEARRRCAGLENVRVSCGSLLERPPAGPFDLLIFSEIGYYFTAEVWRNASARLIRPLARGSVVLAVHWLGKSADHYMSGDEVHEVLEGSELLRVQHAQRHTGFRLERWERV